MRASNKRIAFILLLVGIVFFAYLFRGTFLGYDSYYFLNIISGLQEPNTFLHAILFQNLLPNNQILLKVILCELLALNIIITSTIGAKMLEEKGWLAGPLLFLNPLFIVQSLWLEEEQFLFPLYFFAVAFLFAVYKKKLKVLMVIPAFLILVSWLLWFGFQIPIIFWFSEPEYIPFLSAIPLILVLPGLAGYWKNKALKPLKPYAIGVTLLALLCQKTAVFSAPFLAIGLVALLKETGFSTKQFLGFFVLLALISGVAIQFIEPFPQDFKAAEFAVEKSKELDKRIVNNWSYGYIIINAGGSTHNFAGGAQPKDFKNSIAVVDWELPNCQVIKQFQEIKVYNCP